MFHTRCARAALILLLVLTFPACGAESPSSPTPASTQTTMIVQSSGFGGATTTCQSFDNAKAGPVTIFVTPPSIHLVLSTGPCNTPGQILAEKDTELINVTAPAGSNHLTLSNPPAGADTSYMLRITYWR